MKGQIWENFEKKDLKMGFDFQGQLIFKGEVDVILNIEGSNLVIDFGHGQLKINRGDLQKF